MIFRHKRILILSLIVSMMQVIQIKGQPFVLDQNVSDSLTAIFNGDVLWGDYDADGDLDILIAGSTLNGAVTEIYKNEGSSYAALNLGLLNLENSSVSWCDFDSDNDLDFLLMGTDTTGNKNLPSAILYQNIGNDNFEQFEAGLLGVYDGKSAWGDLDNDGDQDLVMIGDKGDEGVTRIYRQTNNEAFGLIDHNILDIYNGDIALGDYDNDMDLDILIIGVVVNADKSEDKILKLYRNEGDFNFIGVYAEFVGMSESCLQWADYDSNGYLDIIANGSTEAPTHLVYLYQNLKNDNFLNIGIEIFGTVNGSVSWGDYNVDGDLDFLLTGMPSYIGDPITELYKNVNVNLFNKDDSVELVDIYQSQAQWGDYDNDGDLDVLMSGFQTQNDNPISIVYNNQIETINTIPSTPSNLQSTVLGNTVTISWAISSDNETPDDGLTYSIRVGTEPGLTDIVSSMSNPNGKLLVPQLGNVNHNKSWELKNLLPGIYFWSVQAVDNNFEGSAYAQEQSFEIFTSGTSNNMLVVNSNGPLINSYPNPFSDIITFEVKTKENSVLSAYITNISGQFVRTISGYRQKEKCLLMNWNGENEQGKMMPEGLYYFIVQFEDFLESKKVILTK